MLDFNIDIMKERKRDVCYLIVKYFLIGKLIVGIIVFSNLNYYWRVFNILIVIIRNGICS